MLGFVPLPNLAIDVGFCGSTQPTNLKKPGFYPDVAWEKSLTEETRFLPRWFYSRMMLGFVPLPNLLIDVGFCASTQPTNLKKPGFYPDVGWEK